MAVFDRLSPELIRRNFTYRGWFCGLVPVYVGNLNAAFGPDVAARNGVPDLLLDLAEMAWNGFCSLMVYLDPRAAMVGFPIRITSRIDGRPIRPGELPS